jgi:hypothetical protein
MVALLCLVRYICLLSFVMFARDGFASDGLDFLMVMYGSVFCTLDAPLPAAENRLAQNLRL